MLPGLFLISLSFRSNSLIKCLARGDSVINPRSVNRMLFLLKSAPDDDSFVTAVLIKQHNYKATVYTLSKASAVLSINSESVQTEPNPLHSEEGASQ